MRLETLPDLCHEIEQTFSRKIRTAADCLQLAEEVFKKTGKSINSNTLRRCFQLIKSDYPPSISTLNILANYCGFATLEEFVEYKKQRPSTETNKPLLSFLVNLFGNLDVSQQEDATYINLVRNIIQYFKLYPSIIHDFQKEIAKTKNGQKYYFETFINTDQLQGYYGEGLRYYITEKNCAHGQIFGNYLLLLKSWLLMDHAKLDKHYHEVAKYPFSTDWAIPVQAYHLSSQILFSDANNKDINAILLQASAEYKRLKTNHRYNTDLLHFLMVLSEVMVLVAEYKEALFYANEGFNLLNEQKLSIDSPQRFHALALFKAISLEELDETENCKKTFNKINPDSFPFLAKNYLKIFYLSLDSKINNKRNNNDQIKFLIDETGFKRLEMKVNKYVAKKARGNQHPFIARHN